MPSGRSTVLAISDRFDRLIVFKEMLVETKCLFIVRGSFFCMIRGYAGFSFTVRLAVTCVLFFAAIAHFRAADKTCIISKTTSLMTGDVRHDLNFCTC